MIRHVVMFKLRRDADPAEVEDWLRRLRGLPGQIDFVKNFSVGRDQLHLPRSYDVALVCDFDTLDLVKEYGDHPAHVPVAATSRSLSEHICSVDFEL